MPNQEQFTKISTGNGFIAALDQSGGSTPKALKNYGIDESAYSGEEEMFSLVHQMRTRIITSPLLRANISLAPSCLRKPWTIRLKALRQPPIFGKSSASPLS